MAMVIEIIYGMMADKWVKTKIMLAFIERKSICELLLECFASMEH
jgi:hypothetical protein